jgi:hypothetical protein
MRCPIVESSLSGDRSSEERRPGVIITFIARLSHCCPIVEPSPSGNAHQCHAAVICQGELALELQQRALNCHRAVAHTNANAMQRQSAKANSRPSCSRGRCHLRFVARLSHGCYLIHTSAIAPQARLPSHSLAHTNVTQRQSATGELALELVEPSPSDSAHQMPRSGNLRRENSRSSSSSRHRAIAHTRCHAAAICDGRTRARARRAVTER